MDGRVGVYMRDDTMITCTVLLSYLILNNNVHYTTYFLPLAWLVTIDEELQSSITLVLERHQMLVWSAHHLPGTTSPI